jgi:hypothetical protein
MATKMADFMQKYVQSYNTGYIEAILQIIKSDVLEHSTNQGSSPEAIELF